jgi:hypothetical protein
MGRAEDLFLRIKDGGASEIDKMVAEASFVTPSRE